jgi:hypothetical protein
LRVICIEVKQVQTANCDRCDDTAFGGDVLSNAITEFKSPRHCRGNRKVFESRHMGANEDEDKPGAGTPSQLCPDIRRLPQSVRWQFAKAVLVGSGKVAEVPEAPPKRFFRDRRRSKSRQSKRLPHPMQPEPG